MARPGASRRISKLPTPNSTHVLPVNLNYTTPLSTSVVGPGNLSVFNPTNRTWIAQGHAYANVTLLPGGCVLVALSSSLRPAVTLTGPEAGRNYFTNAVITASADVSSGTAPYTVTFYTNRAGGAFGPARTVTTVPYAVTPELLT